MIQAQLAPGSMFKIFMTTAMLESKAVPEDYKVFCPGYAEFYGRIFHDAEKDHGEVDLHKAIVESCDVYFYNVGQTAGHRPHFLLRDKTWPRPQDRRGSSR